MPAVMPRFAKGTAEKMVFPYGFALLKIVHEFLAANPSFLGIQSWRYGLLRMGQKSSIAVFGKNKAKYCLWEAEGKNFLGFRPKTNLPLASAGQNISGVLGIDCAAHGIVV
jgi:hypothetical protein